MREYTDSTFEPRDQQEHERGNRGEEVPDYCAKCGNPFMEHYNGQCPKNEEDK